MDQFLRPQTVEELAASERQVKRPFWHPTYWLSVVFLAIAVVAMLGVVVGCSSPAPESPHTASTVHTVYSDRQMIQLFNDPVVQNMLGYPVTEDNLQTTLADQCPLINTPPPTVAQDIMAAYKTALRDSGRCTAELVSGS